jgi:hypothetical protein
MTLVLVGASATSSCTTAGVLSCTSQVCSRVWGFGVRERGIQAVCGRMTQPNCINGGKG